MHNESDHNLDHITLLLLTYLLSLVLLTIIFENILEVMNIFMRWRVHLHDMDVLLWYSMNFYIFCRGHMNVLHLQHFQLLLIDENILHLLLFWPLHLCLRDDVCFFRIVSQWGWLQYRREGIFWWVVWWRVAYELIMAWPFRMKGEWEVSLQSRYCGRVVKAMDLKSIGFSRAGSNPANIVFYILV